MTEYLEKVKPVIPQHYIKVPKEVILESDIPEYRISILIYLNVNQGWNSLVNYSPKYMIQWSGYSPNWRKRTDVKCLNIYEKYTQCMNWFHYNGYIIDFDQNEFIGNNLQSSLINRDKLNPKNNFGIIYDFEFDAILKYESSYKPLNKSVLLLLLAYIRAYTWIRQTELTGHSEKSKKEKPEIFYSQFKTIGNFIGLNERMVSKATSVLEDIGIIKIYKMPKYQDSDGNWHTNDIIYVFNYKFETQNGNTYLCSKEVYDPNVELENGIIFLQESKYKDKKFNQK